MIKIVKKKTGFVTTMPIAKKYVHMLSKKKKKTFLDDILKDECETNAANTLAPVQRSTKMKCSVRVTEALSPLTALEGPRVRVILISEGLGNRMNMNYYGPEAIDSAPAIFEGKPAFLNHPSESEERDIPERRVQDKCGYFKGLHVETLEGKRSLVGELHFDLSDAGRDGYAKALTALHYDAEFPLSTDDYVGLSVNAAGDVIEKTVEVDGQPTEVNYVNKFTSAVSCDIVTVAGRGGRFLALVESAAGASTNKKQEDGHMKEKLKKCLEAARSALKEALKETNADKAKLKMAESDKLFDAFFKEAMQQSADPEEETQEAVETEESDTEESKAKKEKKEADDGDSEDEEEDPKDKKAMKQKKEKKEKKEANRVVVLALAKEAKVELDEHRLDKLSELSFQEAKAEIASLKSFKESIVRSAVKAMEVPGTHFEKLNEAERAEAGEKNNDLFASCVQ